jgi:hypothetical protein
MSMKVEKRLRVLTNRDFPDGKSFEAIERDPRSGQFFWYAEDIPLGVVACFPCDVAFVREKFLAVGRVFDPEKLPAPTLAA